ncbi:MAG: DUF58 domain-containing protein [Leptolyngbyaceae cyanobacterium RM1_406_9]|nr:DUF58 domain-containing protein [Leptolyngbyaceae cyanobacterium RM1_406_9]
MQYQQINHWLETRWVKPAFSGWLLAGLSLFFFAAATNTMAGWLYVISGVIFALLAIATILPRRSLRQIRVVRQPIQPVSSGEPLTIELELHNPTPRPKTLIEVQDLLPHVLSKPVKQALELIPAEGVQRWVYQQPTQRRGVYRWHTVNLRTAAPLGLFWSRQSRTAKAIAIVYPTVLPLSRCPLVDEMGKDVNNQVQNNYRPLGATEGVTRTLRPYRWGDPIRLVHWRTSARYGELRVRELEVFTGGQEVVIGLDSAIAWNLEDFEQAVIAAASLYFYAVQRQLQVSLWTAQTGLLRGGQAVLEALAETYAGEEEGGDRIPPLPLVWLSQNPDRLSDLPQGSRWLLWQRRSSNELQPEKPPTENSLDSNHSGFSNHPGFVVQPEKDLQIQLQAPLPRY